MKVTRQNIFTGVRSSMELDVTPEQLIRWEYGGELIQDVMPHLTPDEREFLMTGATAHEWNEMFGTEED